MASGEQANRLRAAYLARFDESLDLRHREGGAFLRAWLRRTLPDGDFPTWKRYPDELRTRSVKVGVGLYQHLGIVRGDRDGRDAHARHNLAFFGAPTVAFLLVHEDLLPFSAHDGGLMLQTLMLSATARGVGSCAMGELATWRGPLEAEFELDPAYKLLTGLALGYPSDAPVNQFRAEHPPVPLTLGDGSITVHPSQPHCRGRFQYRPPLPAALMDGPRTVPTAERLLATDELSAPGRPPSRDHESWTVMEPSPPNQLTSMDGKRTVPGSRRFSEIGGKLELWQPA